MDFKVFKTAVAAQFDKMKKHKLFRTQASKDALWETYLGSFPEGTDPIYQERTEHNCNTCKQFICAVGNVVAIVDDKLLSIWDIDVADKEPGYQVVADALAALVKSQPIDNVFYHFERTVGVTTTVQQLLNKSVITWNHFFVNVPNEYVMLGRDQPSVLGEIRADFDVFARTMREITPDSYATVLELISSKSLYRGEDHKHVLVALRDLKNRYDNATNKDLFLWSIVRGGNTSGAILRARNTSIGTLLVDLSNDVELDRAVASFESKVAPANYKRPTALVTKAMIEKAKQTVEELGYTSALQRRHAVADDISVNNVLFADRTTRGSMLDNKSVFDELTPTKKTTKSKSNDTLEEVTIDTFVKDILPLASSIEVLFENAHVGNLMSVIAPSDPSAENMFKWDNRFSWSYNGEFADSAIKERVKKAGGSVVGDVCCRLAWSNYDDLDFYMYEPKGYEIYFGNRHTTSPNGGRLDVDMNAGRGTTRTPVENIFYSDRRKMKPGKYELKVHQFSKRESTDVGFQVEIDICGQLYSFDYSKAVRDGEYIHVATLNYDGNTFVVDPHIECGQPVKNVWNLNTTEFHKVNMIMNSPNYWDGNGVGNKHFFFILDRCVNDGSARGFFNEFLKDELTPHRKVMEMVGSKLKAEVADKQLSGLGFSSTVSNSIVCRVTGTYTRMIKVVFNK